MLLMVKIHFRLAYRALEGFMKCLADLNKWDCAIFSYSLICRRATSVKQSLPPLSKCCSSVILVDASGAKVVGEGEWKVKIHGRQRRRKWVKVHIAIDPKTQEIVAEATTASSIKDGKMLKTLLNNTRGPIATVVADGAYDEQEAREEIRKRRAQALIPPPCNAILHGTDPDRDDAIRVIRGLDGDKEAKSLWGKLTGYSIRALVETAFSRVKRLFGERLFSKVADKQAVENRLRCLILNKMRSEAFVSAPSALG